MGRSLKYEIPGIDPRVEAEALSAQGWAAVFARARAAAHAGAGDSVDAGATGAMGEGAAPTSDTPRRRRVVEIGFGRGEFLLDLALGEPETEFLGIEISWKRGLKMARKVARERLANVVLAIGRGQEILRDALEPGSLDALWVNFSDPWPKLRHADRRLVQPAFAALAARALAPGGVLQVATDDVPYAQQIDEVLAAEKGLVNRNAPLAFLPEVAGRRMTGYEAQWRAEGRPLHFFTYAVPALASAGAVR